MGGTTHVACVMETNTAVVYLCNVFQNALSSHVLATLNLIFLQGFARNNNPVFYLVKHPGHIGPNASW